MLLLAHDVHPQDCVLGAKIVDECTRAFCPAPVWTSAIWAIMLSPLQCHHFKEVTDKHQRSFFYPLSRRILSHLEGIDQLVIVDLGGRAQRAFFYGAGEQHVEEFMSRSILGPGALDKVRGSLGVPLRADLGGWIQKANGSALTRLFRLSNMGLMASL